MIATIFFTFLVLAAEILYSFGVLNAELFPVPHILFRSFVENKDLVLQASLSTFTSSCLGFILSVAVGSFISLLSVIVPLIRKGILPFAVFFQTVPIIAIAPLLVIFLGFGKLTVVVAAVIVGLFPVVASFTTALFSIPKDYLELMQFYRATPLQIFWRVRLPAAFNGIYSGLKIAAGLSVIGVVAGEFVAGGGLGALIDSARTQQRVDLVYLALLGLSMIGIGLIFFIDSCRFLLLKIRPFV